MNENTLQDDPGNLTEDELNKLGLSEHPFLEHAEDAFLYSDSQLEMTSNIVMEYLTNPATTIVLSGEDGVGKTTYLRKVLRLGYQQYQFCTLRARDDIDFDYIENKIKQRWVLPETNEHTSVVDLSIENYVITYLREHTHAVLILDDAHLLDSATLDRLFTLKHRIGLACPLSLGFILAGENSLKSAIASLEDSNPACTQVYQIDVRPLNREQTAKYIDHRLKTAGLENETVLDDVQITEIYKATQGNIRQIHDLVILTLQSQCREGTLEDALGPDITIRNPKPRVPVLLVALLGIVGLGLYINHRINLNNVGEGEEIPLEKPLIDEPTLSPIAQESHNPTDKQTPSLPLPKEPLRPADKELAQIDIRNIEANNQNAPKVGSLLTESIEHIDDNQLNVVENHLQTTLEKNQQINEPPTIAGQTPELPSTSELNTTSEDKVKLPPVEKSTIKSQATQGEDWLKQLNASSYTLQVVATKDVKQLETLVAKEGLNKEYAYFDKRVKDATFYVLVIGNYKTRDDALAAVAKLSNSLQKNKPWPITLKDVQKHLN